MDTHCDCGWTVENTLDDERWEREAVEYVKTEQMHKEMMFFDKRGMRDEVLEIIPLSKAKPGIVRTWGLPKLQKAEKKVLGDLQGRGKDLDPRRD